MAADFSNYNALLGAAGWQAVRRHAEELRVLYVMRDPVQQLWSHMKFELLPIGKREALVRGDMEEVGSFLASASSAHARYDEIIASLRRNLLPEELLVVRLEDIVADIAPGLNRLAQFLGIPEISYSDIDPNRKANKTEEIPIPPQVRSRLVDFAAKEAMSYMKYDIRRHDS